MAREFRRAKILRSRSRYDELRAKTPCTFCGRKPGTDEEMIGMYFPTICERCVRKASVAVEKNRGKARSSGDLKLADQICLFCFTRRDYVYTAGSGVICKVCVAFCRELLAKMAEARELRRTR